MLGRILRHTSAAENTGDLDELDGDLSGFHIYGCVCKLERWGVCGVECDRGFG